MVVVGLIVNKYRMNNIVHRNSCLITFDVIENIFHIFLILLPNSNRWYAVCTKQTCSCVMKHDLRYVSISLKALNLITAETCFEKPWNKQRQYQNEVGEML